MKEIASESNLFNIFAPARACHIASTLEKLFVALPISQLLKFDFL